MLIACIPIGGGVGSLISGIFIQKFSRKYPIFYIRNNILFANVFALIAGLIIFVPTVEMLFAARFLQGICAGYLSSIAPIIMKELSPV